MEKKIKLKRNLYPVIGVFILLITIYFAFTFFNSITQLSPASGCYKFSGIIYAANTEINSDEGAAEAIGTAISEEAFQSELARWYGKSADTIIANMPEYSIDNMHFESIEANGETVNVWTLNKRQGVQIAIDKNSNFYFREGCG